MSSIHHATAKRAARENIAIAQTMHQMTMTDSTLAATWAFAPDYDAAKALAAVLLARHLHKEHGVKITEKAGVYTAKQGRREIAQAADLDEVTEHALHAAEGAAHKAAKKAAKPAKAKVQDEDGEGEGDEGEGDEGEGEGEGEGDEATTETETEEGDEPTPASVVKDKYRAQYKALGHPNHCGDAMAQRLNAYMGDAEGESGEVLLDALAEANALGDKWATYAANQTRGWIGRARMSLGNILRGRQRRIEAGKDETPVVIPGA